MKKSIVLTLVVAANLFILAGLGGCKQEEAVSGNKSVGVITLQDIYSNSKVGKGGVAYLEGLEKLMLDKYTELSGKIEKAQESNDEALQERLQVEMQAFAYGMQNLMTKEQERVVEIISKNVKEGMENYRKSAGLSLILASDNDFVQAFDPALDATQGVLAALDALTFDFGEYPALDQSAGQVESSVILPEGMLTSPEASESSATAPASEPAASGTEASSGE